MKKLDTRQTLLEICCGSYASALAAQAGGAHRVELCSGLEEGGLTPSSALIAEVCKLKGIVHHVLIRPRGGDFLYTEAEKRIILADINHAAELGADGVVIGALQADGGIDVDFTKKCVAEACGLNVTFHRAFDMCDHPLRSLEGIIDCGCTHLLTSGQAPTAELGIPLLCQLVEQADERIEIMPGCGVSPANAARILRESGARQIHASARTLHKSRMKFVQMGVTMGSSAADEYALKDTSENVVREIIFKIGTLN